VSVQLLVAQGFSPARDTSSPKGLRCALFHVDLAGVSAATNADISSWRERVAARSAGLQPCS
jgi:hypothetical protein